MHNKKRLYNMAPLGLISHRCVFLSHYHDNHISFATLPSRLKRVRYDNNLKLNGKNILQESGRKKTITELIFATEMKRNLLCRILFYQHYFFREKMTNVSFGIRNIS